MESRTVCRSSHRRRHVSEAARGPAPAPPTPRPRQPACHSLVTHIVTTGAGVARARAPAGSPRRRCRAMRHGEPGKALGSFPSSSPHHLPSRQRKKPVATQTPKTLVGSPTGTAGSASSSIPGTCSYWPSPSTLGRHPPWTRNEKAAASLELKLKSDEQGKCSSSEQLDQSHSFANCSIFLERASPPPPWVFATRSPPAPHSGFSCSRKPRLELTGTRLTRRGKEFAHWL